MNLSELSVEPENLASQARTAVLWRFLSQGVGKGLQMITSIILARLLMPQDFGIVAMAVMVSGLAGLFSELGMGQALVQRRNLKHTHLASAFWGTLLMGSFLCALLVVLAPYAAGFFREPRMAPVLQVISLSFLITPFGVLPRSLLQRQLDFKRLFIAEMAGNVSYAAVGLSMALTGYSYWSLVAAQLASSLVGTISICAITGYLSPLNPSLQGFKDLSGFGVGITGVSLLNYTAQQADYFVVGRWLDSAALGLYTRAFTLVHMPLSFVSGVLSAVLFPTFAHIQEDPERTRRAFTRALMVISLPTFPGLALLGVSAPELIPLLLGEQWLGAVLPTQIMVVAGMLRLIANPGGAVAHARGAKYVYSEVWRQGVYAALLFAGAYVGITWGIVGVAWAVVAVTLVAWALGAHLVYLCSGFTVTHYVNSLLASIITAACTSAGAILARYALLAADASVALVLIGTLLGGFLAALVPMILGVPRHLREARGYLLSIGHSIRTGGDDL